MSPVSKSNDSNDWSLFKKQRNVVNSEIRLAKQAYYQNSVFIVSDKTLPFSYHSSCLFYIKGLLPGPSRRLAPIIKCNAFLCFQSYIVRDISLTEIYRWLVNVGVFAEIYRWFRNLK